MLEPVKNQVPSKCMLTLGQLPKFNDPKQPPSKTKPYSTILEKPFIHSLDLTIPSHLYDAVHAGLPGSLIPPKYALVSMTLLDVLSGPFFTTYIKTGTIALQSVGRPGVDSVYSLYNGVLRLELPRDRYERAGLSGSPIRDGGRKHMKERFAVEVNLRLPSMVAGRKGFERLKRAAGGVLNETTKWLFADLKGELEQDDAPIQQLATEMKEVQLRTDRATVTCPPMVLSRANRGPYADAVFEDEAMELLEWMDLVQMGSPRVQVGTEIDPFLSRYAVPGAEAELDIVRLSWHGFIPTVWVRDVLATWLNGARKIPSQWLAMSGTGFRTAAVDSKLGWTLLRLPEKAVEENKGADIDLLDAPAESKERSDDRGITGSRHFPQFILYELTAGEHW